MTDFEKACPDGNVHSRSDRARRPLVSHQSIKRLELAPYEREAFSRHSATDICRIQQPGHRF